MPRDFGRVKLAISMAERIQAMKDFGAEFVADSSRVLELQEGYHSRREEGNEEA